MRPPDHITELVNEALFAGDPRVAMAYLVPWLRGLNPADQMTVCGWLRLLLVWLNNDVQPEQMVDARRRLERVRAVVADLPGDCVAGRVLAALDGREP